MGQFNSNREDVGRSDADSTLRIGRLPAPVHESSLKSLISNLRDFLTERPAKLRPGQETAFRMPEFGRGLLENLAEIFKPTPRNVHSDLLVSWKEESFWQNVR